MYEEIHFLPCSYTTLMHGSVVLPSGGLGSVPRFLLANRRQLLFLRMSDGGECWLEDLPLSRMPKDAEIISVDAFFPSRWSLREAPVVGVTLHQSKTISGQRATSYFNIYGIGSAASSMGQHPGHGQSDLMKHVVSQCQRINLAFVPLQLTHTTVQDGDGQDETVFLLCGDDMKVHVYVECEGGRERGGGEERGWGGEREETVRYGGRLREPNNLGHALMRLSIMRARRCVCVPLAIVYPSHIDWVREGESE
jgi:hypothetical protein